MKHDLGVQIIGEICSAKKQSLELKKAYIDIASKLPNDLVIPEYKNLPMGCAIAIVHLADCIHMDEDFIKRQDIVEISCGNWQPGRYAWKLTDIRTNIPNIIVKCYQIFFWVDF